MFFPKKVWEPYFPPLIFSNVFYLSLRNFEITHIQKKIKEKDPLLSLFRPITLYTTCYTLSTCGLNNHDNSLLYDYVEIKIVNYGHGLSQWDDPSLSIRVGSPQLPNLMTNLHADKLSSCCRESCLLPWHMPTLQPMPAEVARLT